jgi:hypothetical protein
MPNSGNSQTAGDDAIQIGTARDVTIKKRRRVLLLLLFTLCTVCTIVVNNEEYKNILVNFFPQDSQPTVRGGLDNIQSAIHAGLDKLRPAVRSLFESTDTTFVDGGLIGDWEFIQMQGGDPCYLEIVIVVCPQSVSFFPNGDYRFIANLAHIAKETRNISGTYTVIDSNSVKLEGPDDAVIYDFAVSGDELKLIDSPNIMIFQKKR